METYLPYENFKHCSDIIASPERFEAVYAGIRYLDVIHQLDLPDVHAWARHPGVEMWRGHEVALWQYIDTMFTGFGPPETWNETIKSLRHAADQHLSWATSGDFSMDMPKWMGMEQLHLAHQALLVRTQPRTYASRFPDVDASLPMVWPVIKEV